MVDDAVAAAPTRANAFAAALVEELARAGVTDVVLPASAESGAALESVKDLPRLHRVESVRDLVGWILSNAAPSAVT